MIIMTTALILAGGKSSRMGQDKAVMLGGVERIQRECRMANISRVITLCGSEIRRDRFPGEVWVDPTECNGLIDVISWALEQINDDVLMIPCDAFNLTSKGICALIKLDNCIPTDKDGIRQPLHARISNKSQINWQATSVNELFVNFPDYQNIALAQEFTNFNSPEDLRNHR